MMVRLIAIGAREGYPGSFTPQRNPEVLEGNHPPQEVGFPRGVEFTLRGYLRRRVSNLMHHVFAPHEKHALSTYARPYYEELRKSKQKIDAEARWIHSRGGRSK
jgi:hypothetical protein